MTSDTYAPLRALLSNAGYAFVEPPIVHPARVFVELAGEELRRRLYLTSGGDGEELALRPDYTIPVALLHLATGAAKRKANYAYLGPVFRIRADGPGEFLQAGVESLGRTDRAAADADVLALAFTAAGVLGVRKPAVRIGDSGLFAALLDALDLNATWQRRLERSFGDTARLKALIGKANGNTGTVAHLTAGEKTKARHRVEALLAETGLGIVGGRTSDEIVARYVEKRTLAEGIGATAARVLGAFLKIGGPPQKALADIAALARAEKLDVTKALAGFEKRTEAFETRGIDVDRLAFAADFGRRLDYYTGFVFEFYRGKDTKPVIGGGRYDKLMALIPGPGGGTRESVPAVGFSIWLDRVGAP
jgi:ATP phosphoribosyltransferase regulatory subunit